MFYLLKGVEIGALPWRLFGYVSFRTICAAATAMLIVVFFGPLMVRILKSYRAMAVDRYKGIMPEEFINSKKNSTPSMGGILIIAGIVLTSLLWSRLDNAVTIALISQTVMLGGLGFLDDYVKITSNPKGISSRVKMAGQILISIAILSFLFNQPELAEHLRDFFVPFRKIPIFSNAWISGIVAGIVIIGASNAVNLTDGKDGLATGSCIICIFTYGALAYLCGHQVFASYLSIPNIPGVSEAVVFSGAVVGACAGFLWHNCYPASMFMGDTGSLALGGIVGLLAVLVRQELLLIVAGGVFVMEAGSVILQVASFKLTGKRIFLCSPIHHHFERKGWTETQIVVRFWILSGVFALIALASLKIR